MRTSDNIDSHEPRRNTFPHGEKLPFLENRCCYDEENPVNSCKNNNKEHIIMRNNNTSDRYKGNENNLHDYLGATAFYKNNNNIENISHDYNNPQCNDNYYKLDTTSSTISCDNNYCSNNNICSEHNNTHVLFRSSILPPFSKTGNTAPSFSGVNAPTFVRHTEEGRKIYTVRNVSFEVDNHYDVIKAIGLGAYGLVCSAIDLRYVPDHPCYQHPLLELEEKGGMVLRNSLTGELRFYESSKRTLEEKESSYEDQENPQQRKYCYYTPTLRYDPFFRRKVSNNFASPYVAIKKIPKLFSDLIDGKRVIREVMILQYLRGHPNIVSIHDILLPRQPKESFHNLYLVTELMDTDLHLVLKCQRLPLTEAHNKYIIYQLLCSLLWTHSSGVCHRDLKPGNLLLTSSCDLRVCDYGLARGGLPWQPFRMRLATDNERRQQRTFSPAEGIGSVREENVNAFQGSTNFGKEKESCERRGMISCAEKEVGFGTQSAALSSQDDYLPHHNMPTFEPQEVNWDTHRRSRASKIGTNMFNNSSNIGNNIPEDPGTLMELTDYVITRYYRPPELLILSHYNTCVDIWGVGCILAEMLLHRPLFPGNDYLSQLNMICQCDVLSGFPCTPLELDEMFVGGLEGKLYLRDLFFKKQRGSTTTNINASLRSSITTVASGSVSGAGANNDGTGGVRNGSSSTKTMTASEHIERMRMSLFGRQTGKKLSDEGIDLLSQLLSFDPRQRPTALEAIRHPYFKDIYLSSDECIRDPKVSAWMVAKPINHRGGADRHTSVVLDIHLAHLTSSQDHQPLTLAKINNTLSLSPSNITNYPIKVTNDDYDDHRDDSYNGYWETDDEDPSSMWAFDQRNLRENELREMFYHHIQKFKRRNDRMKALT